MSAKRLILATLLIASPALAQDDPVATAAARMKAFPVMQSVERADAYTPAETVKGRPRALMLAKESGGIDPAALTAAQAYADAQNSFALVVMRDGKVVHERYASGFTADSRFSPASMAKAVAALTFGTANIPLDARVDRWLTEWKGDPRGSITVRQLLTMTSGVRWNEDYTDPKSDVALFGIHKAEPGVDVTVSYMRKLPREAPAGTKWVYKTGETNLIGVLVSSATKKTLSAYLSEKIWKPYGMAQDAVWITGSTGHEISGCCVSASLQDYARFGQFMLDGAVAGGKRVVPDDWSVPATSKQADIAKPGRGYGYQWWTNDDGSYAAQGIFGQGIFIDPKRRLIIATNGNWKTATDEDGVGAERERFYKAVQASVDQL